MNIVTGDGPTCGGALVAHKDVRRIAFTGSVSWAAITAAAGIKTEPRLGGRI